MTPDQFVASLEKHGPAPVYLFLGPEPYQRERCRRALLDALLGAAKEERQSGFSRVDLDEVPLAAAFDDARSLSLFATRRVIWIAGAEAALPRAVADSDEPDNELARYLHQPAPDTTVVIEASRYGFDGDDKAKLQRGRKFF